MDPRGRFPAALICNANAAVPPQLRAEGLTEFVGDLVLTCTGGTPIGAGVALPKLNITVFLNTNATSRVLSSPWSEALMLIDEPASSAQLPCQTADNVCSILGTGTGVGTYSGSTGRPNVFQGKTSNNQITWTDTPSIRQETKRASSA